MNKIYLTILIPRVCESTFDKYASANEPPNTHKNSELSPCVYNHCGAIRSFCF